MIEIVNTTRRAASRRALSVPFSNIADAILGKKFELSLVLCGDTLSTRINREYRNKTYRPNVLSFPLSDSTGEIYLNLRVAEAESKKYAIRFEDRVAYLFIHGCIHVKGLDHGPAMNKLERHFLQKFHIDHPTE